jgi:hypothetical protein
MRVARLSYVGGQERIHPLKTLPYTNKDETGKVEAQRGGQESLVSSMSSNNIKQQIVHCKKIRLALLPPGTATCPQYCRFPYSTYKPPCCHDTAYRLQMSHSWHRTTRVIEGGERRRLTTEEMIDLVAEKSSLKQELDRAMTEAKEKESMLEELCAELEKLRRMRQWEVPNAYESQERKTDAESVKDAVEQKLAPFTEL